MTAFMLHIIKRNVIAAVVILLVGIVAAVTKGKYTSRWKYDMWLIISLFLLFPVNISGISPIRLQVVQQQMESWTDGRSIAALDGDWSDSNDVSNIKDGETVTGIKISEERISQKEKGIQTDQNRKGKAAQTAASGQQDPVNGSHIIDLTLADINLYGVLQLATVVWMAGAVLLAAWRILRYRLALHHLMRWSRAADDGQTLECYRMVCRRKRIVHAPALLVNENITTPMLAGLGRTCLFLPEQPYELSELELIFEHELSHYQHRDLWYKMLLLCVTTVYWFNPALYWMQIQAERDIENICDGAVVKDYTEEERIRYGRLLLKTAAFQNRIPYLAASLNDSTLVFKERINYMVNIRGLKEKLLPVLVLGSALLLSDFLVGSAATAAAGYRGVNAGAESVPGQESSLKTAGTDSGAGSADASGAESTGTEQRSGAVTGNGITEYTAENTGAPTVDGTVAVSSGGEVTEEVGSDSENHETVSGRNTQTVGISFTGYTTDSINVRSDGAADASVIGSIGAGDMVTVTGMTQDGAWYQISFDGAVGYVSADYISQTVSGTGAGSAALTDEQITLYAVGEPGANYVNLGTDGIWYDGSGRQYQNQGNDQWIRLGDGSSWTDTAPVSAEERIRQNAADAGEAVTAVSVVDEEGLNRMTLYYDTQNDIWVNAADGVFTSTGDGTWTGMDGSRWTLTE